ncbi:hypothetical protein RJ640_001821 [Escallonia rubra]|uniref:Pentatricopeptide repeat-containing protein n=1 Tax=Escallonia rubra TaxID=112253 RepID=A0AA88QU77_9ASTE|nr:hypothetical protein RJ640_001821 [Escallonia rubra]
MPERTVVAWNSMISGYEQNGFAEEAIGLFNTMRDFGIEFDSATFVSVLSACSQLGAFGLGCWVHEYVENKGIDVNVVLGTAFINMYARCRNVRKAREIFDWMEGRNVVAWTAMISAYGMHGYGREAIDIFHMMKTGGPPPNDVTFIAVLSACAHAGLVSEGHNVLINGLSKQGPVPDALRIIYHALERGIRHGIFTYNTLIDGWCRLEQLEYGIKLYTQMGKLDVLPDVVTYTRGFAPDVVTYCNLIDGFCEKRNLTAGLSIFKLVLKNGVYPDIAVYIVLISMFFKEGRVKNALELFRQMIEKVKKNGWKLFGTLLQQKGFSESSLMNDALTFKPNSGDDKRVITSRPI